MSNRVLKAQNATSITMSKIIEHARRTMVRVKEENDNLNVSIAALAGALISKTNEDVLDITEEEILVDSNPSTMDESHILTIEYDEEGALVYTDDNNDEPSDLDDLPLNTRLELADKLAQLLES